MRFKDHNVGDMFRFEWEAGDSINKWSVTLIIIGFSQIDAIRRKHVDVAILSMSRSTGDYTVEAVHRTMYAADADLFTACSKIYKNGELFYDERAPQVQ